MNSRTAPDSRRGRTLLRTLGGAVISVLLAACVTSPPPGPPVAVGSGCVAPSVLPDGIWFGFVHTAASSISFALACLYSGPDAASAAVEDGLAADDVGEVYIRNRKSTLRSVAVGTGFSGFVFKYLVFERWLPRGHDRG